MEPSYSNRELDVKFDQLHDKLDQILEWKNYIAGGVAVIMAIGAPIAWYIFTKVQDVNEQVIKIQARIPDGISVSLKK